MGWFSHSLAMAFKVYVSMCRRIPVSRSLDLEALHFKNQGRPARNLGGAAAGAVAHVAGDDELALLSHAHANKALVPALDHWKGERKEQGEVTGGIGVQDRPAACMCVRVAQAAGNADAQLPRCVGSCKSPPPTDRKNPAHTARTLPLPQRKLKRGVAVQARVKLLAGRVQRPGVVLCVWWEWGEADAGLSGGAGRITPAADEPCSACRPPPSSGRPHRTPRACA